MSDKRRRTWFQIHLSTAVVLMFVAGGGLWINTLHRNSEREVGLSLGNSAYKHAIVTGWPFAISCNIDSEEKFPGDTQVIRICFNVVIWMVLLILMAAGCEYFIRRREARAP